MMSAFNTPSARQPSWGVIALAGVIIVVGLWLQTLASAPRSALLLQSIGGLVALALIGLVPLLAKRVMGATARWIMAGLCLGLLLLPLLWPDVDGARRWIPLGPLTIQPLPLVLPLLVWMAARDDLADPRWSAPGPIGLALAGPILALQPDQQGAVAVLAVALAMLVPWGRPSGVNGLRRGLVLVVAMLSVIATAARPVGLAPVDHVERVVAIALNHGPVTGALGLMGVIAVVALIAAAAWVPARHLPSARPGLERTGWLLAILWAGFIIGSLGQDYPVPVIGYGLSWVIGWGLTLGLTLAERVRANPVQSGTA